MVLFFCIILDLKYCFSIVGKPRLVWFKEHLKLHKLLLTKSKYLKLTAKNKQRYVAEEKNLCPTKVWILLEVTSYKKIHTLTELRMLLFSQHRNTEK